MIPNLSSQRFPEWGDIIDITLIVSYPLPHVDFGSTHVGLSLHDSYELLDVPEEFDVEYIERYPVYSHHPGSYQLTTKERINFDDGVPRQFTIQVEVIRGGPATINGGVYDAYSKFSFIIGETETLLHGDYYAKYPDERPVSVEIPDTYEERKIWDEKYGTGTAAGYSTSRTDITEEEFRLFLELHDFDHIDDIDAAVAEAYPDEDHHE